MIKHGNNLKDREEIQLHSNGEQIERRSRTGHLITNICKYVFTAGIVLFIIFVYSYTGTSNPPFSKVEDLMQKEIAEDMVDVSSRGLNRYYGLNVADYDGVMMYISGNAMSAEELLVIKVKDESQLNELEKAIQYRIKSRRKDFDGYAPAQAKLLENSKLIIRGKYLLFVASENANVYTKAFLSAI